MKKTLMQLAQEEEQNYSSPIVAAKINGEVRDIQSEYDHDDEISFIELNTSLGWRIYQRSILFLFIVAVSNMNKEAEVVAKFTVNKGLYCEVKIPGKPINAHLIHDIEQEMREMIASNTPIVKHSIPRQEAIELFQTRGKRGKAALIDSLPHPMISIYTCRNYPDYLYGAMLPETKLLGQFALDVEQSGVLIRTPDEMTAGKIRTRVEQPKYISDLNQINTEHRMGELIRISEALQEKRIAQIADHIASHRNNIRLILIAGPSSSGKTSFAQRLQIQLRVNGLHPIMISLDDYFLNREDTPRNEKGEYDYESIDAIDTALFNQNMLELLNGHKVQIPYYNFITGKREWRDDNFLLLKEDQPIIIEGIHGLNERLTADIARKNKYKIYISALTQLNIDAHNRIPTTEVRFLRRLVRDHQFRGAKAIKTIKQWPDVRAGEEKYIFPFQEEADVLFNSALIYEIGVLKKYAVPLLEAIDRGEEGYTEAQLILRFLQYVNEIHDIDDIPNNSIFREFIGKSVFFKEK